MREILRRHPLAITFLAILIALVFLFGDDDAQLESLTGYTMGTTFQVQLWEIPGGTNSTDSTNREKAEQEINDLLDRLDKDIFSTYAPDSELSRFNRHSVGTAFSASSEFIEVMMLARDVSIMTDGAFDVTVGPVVNLWGFGAEASPYQAAVPAASDITNSLAGVGYQHVLIDDSASQLRKTRDVYVDLSAIAKGYAVDQLADYLDESGVDNYFLEIGGELKIKGHKPDGEGWVPAIEAPVDTASRVHEILHSRGETIAVAGSGDYRNYFEDNGIRYSHQIDPRTGHPVTHNLAASYVIDESAALADALATAYMILGLDLARVLAEENSQPAYFIYKTDEGFGDYATPGFERYLNR